MNKKLSIIYLCLILFTKLTIAQDEPVANFVNSVANQAISIVAANNSTTLKKEAVKNLLTTNFDVAWMAKFVLGRNYNELSPAEQSEYTKLYTQYLVSNYFPILMKYNDQKFKIINVVKTSQNSYDVSTQITQDSHPAISLKYHVNQDPTTNSFKAVDMVVEGVSTIISQRSEFNSIIQQNGVKGLLTQMRQKYKA